MEKEKTHLTHVIDEADAKAQFDAHAKVILSNKQVLSRIMQAAVDEVKDYSPDEIFKMIEGEPEIGVPLFGGKDNENSDALYASDRDSPEAVQGIGVEYESGDDGLVKFDVLTHIKVPCEDGTIKVIINVEGQRDDSPGYPIVMRGIYYAARLLSRQKGIEFTKSNYQDIRKVYSIWICFDPAKERESVIANYSIHQHVCKGKLDDDKKYDLLSVVIINLGEEPDKYDINSIQHFLSVIFSEELKPAEKKQIVSNTYGISMYRMIDEEVQKMCNLSEMIADHAREKALAEGTAKGIEQGIEQGIEKGRKEMLIELVNSGDITIECAAAKLGVSVDELLS